MNQNARNEKSRENPLLLAPEEQTEDQCELLQASRRLQAAEKLLLHPTPEAIRDTTLLLEEALSLVTRFSKAAAQEDDRGADVLRGKIDGFQRLCKRVAQLLEGAMRVQWTRMHSIASFTQSYNSKANVQTWKPTGRSLNLEM